MSHEPPGPHGVGVGAALEAQRRIESADDERDVVAMLRINDDRSAGGSPA